MLSIFSGTYDFYHIIDRMDTCPLLLLQVELNTVQTLKSNGVDIVLSELVTHGSEERSIENIKVVHIQVHKHFTINLCCCC